MGRYRSRGFSLVELMISLLLGVIVVGALVGFLHGSKRSWRLDDAVARIQEDARLVHYNLALDVREAGFGCLDNVTNIVSTLNSGSDIDFNFDNVIEGYDSATGYPDTIAASVVSGTDVLVIRGTYGSEVSLETEMPDTSAVLKTTVMDPAPITTDDIVLLTDCNSAAIFQVTNYTDANGNIVHNTGSGTPGNSTKSFGHKYVAGSQVIKVHSTSYYIGTSDYGEPALIRRVNDSGTAEETLIAEGVEDMQLMFGMNTDGISGVDGYYEASQVSDWDDVVSVRFNLLLRSLEDNVLDDDQSYRFNDTDVTATDHYLRRPLGFVVTVRGQAE